MERQLRSRIDTKSSADQSTPGEGGGGEVDGRVGKKQGSGREERLFVDIQTDLAIKVFFLNPILTFLLSFPTRKISI